MARLSESVNEYGTPVAEFRCQTCGVLYTICPAPKPGEDHLYADCTAPECASYDPARDINKWFDEGKVFVGAGGRLFPMRVIEGGLS